MSFENMHTILTRAIPVIAGLSMTFSLASFVAPETAHALQPSSTECKALYNEWLEKPSIRALALSADGNSCGTAWGYDTLEEAKTAAMDNCKKYASTCRITEFSGPAALPIHQDCIKGLADWKKLGGKKSYAISGSGNACGWSYNYDGQRAADTEALRQCNDIGAGCRVIANANTRFDDDPGELEEIGKAWARLNLNDLSRSSIASLQQKLIDAGCADLSVDGQLGTRTYRSLGNCPSVTGLTKPGAKTEPETQVVAVEPKPVVRPEPVQPKDPVATQGRRVALVIGNSSYQHTTPLLNPSNDATAMTGMLQRIGFEVISGIDLDKPGMEAKIREFAREAETADVSLFFYAGHGMQHAGRNYLVPTDAKLEHATAIDFELVDTKLVTTYMSDRDKVAIVLLDACRDNPLSRSLSRSLRATRSAEINPGLAAMQAERGGMLIGFATAPGDVALDGDTNNSPFTTALLKHFPTQGLELQQVMTRVKADVLTLTRQRQRPWHNSDLAREVYLTAN